MVKISLAAWFGVVLLNSVLSLPLDPEGDLYQSEEGIYTSYCNRIIFRNLPLSQILKITWI